MVSTYTVSHYLGGIDYPAGKDSLVNQARKNHAPDDVIQALQNLPDKNYNSMADLWHGIGQEE